MKPILEIESLKKYYGKSKNKTKALDGITFQVMPGEFLGIMGASGSGKTTLLNCISTIDTVTSGHIFVDGKDITALHGSQLANFRGKKLGFIFQDFNLLDTLNAYENISLSLSIAGVKPAEIQRKVLQISEALGICGVLDKYPYQMSGGQQQRLCIARALAVEPKVLLMDEPTSALDPISTSKIEELAMQLKERYTIVIVTHNMQQAVRISDRTAFFLLGELIECGETERLFSQPEDRRTEDYITGRFG